MGGFNQRKPPLRTATVAIDISKAFEWVDHTLLIDAVASTDLHHNLVRWTAAYLRGRQSQVTWQGISSNWRLVKTGVPQGSVLGPVLFNFFVSDCPVDSPSYADDFTFSRSGVNIRDIKAELQQDLEQVVEWAEAKKLVISPSKCSITLFTPDKAREADVHPEVRIGGEIIHLVKHPRILGVTFDPHFHFHRHVHEKVKDCRKKLRILRSLAGSSWGCSKECLVKTYKTHIEPALYYAPAVWSPNISSTALRDLQRIVSADARICTGCHAPTPSDELIMEAQILPAEDRLRMLSEQSLISAESCVLHLRHCPSGPPGHEAITFI